MIDQKNVLPVDPSQPGGIDNELAYWFEVEPKGRGNEARGSVLFWRGTIVGTVEMITPMRCWGSLTLPFRDDVSGEFLNIHIAKSWVMYALLRWISETGGLIQFPVDTTEYLKSDLKPVSYRSDFDESDVTGVTSE